MWIDHCVEGSQLSGLAELEGLGREAPARNHTVGLVMGPYGLILGLSGAWLTAAWTVEILLGLAGLALAGTEFAQAIRESGWKDAPGIAWKAILHGKDVEVTNQSHPDPAAVPCPSTMLPGKWDSSAQGLAVQSGPTVASPPARHPDANFFSEMCRKVQRGSLSWRSVLCGLRPPVRSSPRRVRW
jgi:hypothetical protein